MLQNFSSAAVVIGALRANSPKEMINTSIKKSDNIAGPLQIYKLYPHTELGIPSSNNIGDLLRIWYFKELRPEIKIKATVIWKQYTTPRGPKMKLHITFGSFTSTTEPLVANKNLMLKLLLTNTTKQPINLKNNKKNS